jgi:hypothetical protein
MDKQEFSLGAIQSPPDYRDIYVSQLVPMDVMPESYFVDINNIPIWAQLQLGACVGHAGGKYKQILDFIDTGEIKKLSARFGYAMAKCKDGISSEGTYPRLLAKIYKETGCSTEKTCPNDTTLSHEEYVYNRDITKIPKEALDEAYLAKISGFAFVGNEIESIKQAIIKCHGFILLVQLDNKWWTDKKGRRSFKKEDLLPIQPPTDIISGHEIYVYGYRVIPGDLEIHFINSWGDTWADHGKGYILYSEYKKYMVEMITFTDIPDELLKKVDELPKKFTHNFTKILTLGDKNEEVKFLQDALKQYGTFNYESTGYYGDITMKAVLDFQIKSGIQLSYYERYIMKGSRVGPKTLEKLNELFNK